MYLPIKKKSGGLTPGDGCSAAWTLDGTDFSEQDMTICIFVDSVFNMSSSAGGGTFLMQIDPIGGPGTYVVDATNFDQLVLISLTLDDGQLLFIKEGQIVVTELNSSRARGTFSGAFFDSADLTQTANFQVTNGSFEANF
ncbi:MAG: hypothetical protein AAGD05_01550 [Bacteroidota bacterium]